MEDLDDLVGKPGGGIWPTDYRTALNPVFFVASDVTATEQVREAFANLGERHNTRTSKDTVNAITASCKTIPANV